MEKHPVYVAGIGNTPFPSEAASDSSGETTRRVQKVALSAVVKALLDAGVTYDDVDQSIVCSVNGNARVLRGVCFALGSTGIPIYEVDGVAALYAASQSLKAGTAGCIIVFGIDKAVYSSSRQPKLDADRSAPFLDNAVAAVLVSEDFLRSHSYLWSSAAAILACSIITPRRFPSPHEPIASVATRNNAQELFRSANLAPRDVQLVEMDGRQSDDVKRRLNDLGFLEGALRQVSDDGGLTFYATEGDKEARNSSYSGKDQSVAQSSNASNPRDAATGLTSLCKTVWLLRGWLRPEPVTEVMNCLHYNAAADGTASVCLLNRADERPVAHGWPETKSLKDGRERLGYNPAKEVKPVSLEDWMAVKSRDFGPDANEIQFRRKGGDRAALLKL